MASSRTTSGTAQGAMVSAADFKLAPLTRPVRTMAGTVHTIAVTSGKGGVGKTNIATGLALALAAEGRPTMLLDADLGMANVDVLLDIHAPANLLNVLAGECRLEETILTGPAGLMVVPAASGSKQLAELGLRECAGLVRAFSALEQDIDTLVIDTATGISESVACMCAASNSVLVVANNEPTSVRDSVALIKHLNARNPAIYIHVLANMVMDAREGGEVFRGIVESMDESLESIISYAGFIPLDDALRKAVISRKSVLTAYPQSSAATALARLGRRVRHWPRSRHANGRLEFFVERILQQNNVEMEVMS